MKIHLLCHLLVVALISPLLGAEGLKLGLVVPKEPIVLSEAAMKQAEAAGLNAKQGIELKYRITNTSDSAITIQHGADNTPNILQVAGPGAVNLRYRGMMTMEFRMGRPITIEAGESEEFTISELKYGKRNMDRWLITKAGDYEITLIYVASIGGEKVELKAPTKKLTVKSQ